MFYLLFIIYLFLLFQRFLFYGLFFFFFFLFAFLWMNWREAPVSARANWKSFEKEKKVGLQKKKKKFQHFCGQEDTLSVCVSALLTYYFIYTKIIMIIIIIYGRSVGDSESPQFLE